MVQLPLPWPSYLTACSEKATTVLEKRGVQEARKTLDLAGSLRDKCNIWQYSFFFFLNVRFCLLTTLAPIRTTQEGCSSCCRHLQQGPTGATSERWLFGWCWFLQLLCMAWVLARSCWSMPACLHSTGHVEQALPQEPLLIPSRGANLMQAIPNHCKSFSGLSKNKHLKGSLKRFNRDCGKEISVK